MRHRLATGLSLGALCLAAPAFAQPVFSGDPIDPLSGQPYVVLPGAPLLWPGEDERWGGGDDVVQPGTLGDVDLVIRSVAFAGAFPAPAAGVAAAPVLIAGGASTGDGSDAFFQLALSDGAAVPAAGNPLSGAELNGRGALVLAWADLDGDGFVGPRSADGDADAELELQEALTPIGRQVALLANSTANGDIAVALGAPASVGGLGVALTAAALTGPSAPVFLDGPPIATLLPLLPPVDITRITGNDPPAPDPEYLVDIELEVESDRWFVPAPGDVAPGDPFAIPLDGSSVSVDLLQARAGTAVGAALAQPLDAGFTASLARRVLPAVGAGGARLPVQSVAGLALADDGPGNAVTLALFPADRLGNPTDPGATALVVELLAGPGLALLAPDSDADPSRETVTLDDAEAVLLTLDDAGAAGDGGGVADLVASSGGVPTALLRIDLGGAAPAPGPFSSAKVKLRIKGGGRDRIAVAAAVAAAGLDPGAAGVRLRLTSGAQTVYDRTLAPGAMLLRGGRYKFRDAAGVGARLALVVVPRGGGRYSLRASVSDLTLPVGAQVDPLTLAVDVGSSAFASPLACEANAAATAARCE